MARARRRLPAARFRVNRETTMTHLTGRVVSPLKYREGDGVEMEIPPGPCEIEPTELDVTISWVDGADRGVTAIPLDAYQRHLAAGTLVLD
jgi:hypothetical protein